MEEEKEGGRREEQMGKRERETQRSHVFGGGENTELATNEVCAETEKNL